MTAFSKLQKLPISLITFFIFLITTLPSHAQIYKWVDANNKVHYSDKKDQAGKKAVMEIKAKDPSSNIQATKYQTENKSKDNWRERNEAFNERQRNNDHFSSTSPSKSPSIPDINYDGSKKSNCDLAKGVLKGDIVRKNIFKPLDKDDIAVAKRDVDMFCK